jgi:protein ImuA
MQFISCHNGQLFKSASQWGSSGTKSFHIGLSAIDDLLPADGLARGAVHELLSASRHPTPRFFALLIARATSRAIVWCDPRRTLYPPAVEAAGIPLEKIFLLHPQTPQDQSWAIAECMQCKGVGATIAQVSKLSRIEARRLQLAAEKGGGIGILLRPMDRNASLYAAATRWLLAPVPGLRTLQRWKIQLIHAHGGRVGKTVILEHCRETNTLRAAEPVADRQSDAASAPMRASA